tara:strand:+ start:671 stop:868 length:198 start_codon:yes stop_codon:yes gene_type:complete
VVFIQKDAIRIAIRPELFQNKRIGLGVKSHFAVSLEKIQILFHIRFGAVTGKGGHFFFFGVDQAN